MQEDLTWAICDKVSGKNIGAVWLREDHRRRRDKSRCRVLGYLLDKGWWGQGLMTEAVSCVVDYAFKNLQLELISTYRFSYNHRSGRIDGQDRICVRRDLCGRRPNGLTVRCWM